jgi:uncharacterized protein YjdB
MNSYLTASYDSSSGNDYVLWKSSFPDIVEIEENTGRAKALKAGATMISATSRVNPAITTNITVTVLDANAVTAFAFNQTAFEMEVDDSLYLGSYRSIYAGTYTYVYEYFDVEPILTSTLPITWTSSDVTVAEVGSSGYVYSYKPGATVITATVTNADGSSLSTSCIVTVTGNPVASAAFAKSAYALKLNSKKSVRAAVNIAPVNADTSGLYFESSDPNVAKTGSLNFDNGTYKLTITGYTPGTATITLKNKEGVALASTTVTVEAVPITSLTLKKTSLDLVEGRSKVLSFKVQPANAYIKDYTVETSDYDVAYASSLNSGSFTVYTRGLGTATLTITVNDGISDHTATCKVTVTETKDVDLQISDSTLTLPLKKDKDENKNVAYLQVFNNNSPYEAPAVTWKSSNAKVVKVDRKGYLTVLKEGKATITATLKDGSNKSVKCVVTVKKNLVKKITGNAKITMRTGWERKIYDYVIIDPDYDDLFNPTFTFTSSDEDVVSVNENGQLIANGKGTATITMKAADGSKKTFSLKVKVIDPLK